MASSAKDLVRRARVGGHRDTPPNALHELKRIADHYRAELVPLAELEHAASRHGSPLPAGLHPSVHSAQADSSPTAGNVDVATEETTPDAPNATQESSTQSHRAADAPDQTPASGPAKRIGSYALTASAALAVGLLSLWHPIAGWALGEAHRSAAPPVWGVGLLVLPVVLLGFGIWRAWWTLELDLEAWRERQRRREHRKRTIAAREDGEREARDRRVA